MKLNHLLHLAIALSLLASVNTYLTFAEFYVQYNRTYQGQEYTYREQVYNDNVAGFANVVNFIPGVNNFTDWTEQQLQRLRTLQTLPQTGRVSSSLPQTRLGAPVSIDWRDSNIVSSIKNQGSCGACWAFTSVGLMQSYLIQNGKQSLGIDLSEQFALQCTRSSTCLGGYIQYGLDAISTAIPTQSQYAYSQSSTYYGSSICSASGIETKTARTSYYQITDSELINLLQYRPVAVAVASNGWSSYTSGTISCSSSASVDHAVIAIGYTPSAIIIKNSWGTTWGLNGYGLVSRGSSSNCKITSQVHTIKDWESTNQIVMAILVIVAVLVF